MSFRHTYITNFLYRHGKQEEMDAIKDILAEYGTVDFVGRDNLGYLHGVIKDLDGAQIKETVEQELTARLKEFGVNILINYE